MSLRYVAGDGRVCLGSVTRLDPAVALCRGGTTRPLTMGRPIPNAAVRDIVAVFVQRRRR